MYLWHQPLVTCVVTGYPGIQPLSVYPMAERDRKVPVVIILITPAVISISKGLLALGILYLPCVVEGVAAMCQHFVDNDREEEKRRIEEEEGLLLLLL